MKRVIAFIVLLSISLNSYAFWIWSPKTKKWKNPQYSPLATPYLQYQEALKYFEKKNYKFAHREFNKLLIHYPDAKEAAEAQYYLGRCLEQLDKPYEAYLEYQKVIDSYPNSGRINEIVERQYKIGEYFLDREPKKLLGVSVYDFIEHPSVEIFKIIVEKVPHSPFAPLAQYKLGLILFKFGRYDEAKDAFQKVIDNYPDSEWANPARYQLAIATAKFSPGPDYDSTSLEEARKGLDDFIRKHPDAKISSAAERQLKDLKNAEAKKNFDIAQFYEKQRKYKAARVYYQRVCESYPESAYAKRAKIKLKIYEVIK